MSESARQFGAVVSEALGDGPASSAWPSQRTRFLQALEQRRRRTRLGVAAVATACALGLVVWLALPQSATVTASLEGRRLAEASLLEVPAGGAKTVDFSDGSQVVLASATRFEMTKLSRKRAQLRLDSGQLQASIEKASGMSWTIDAGPYAVQVVGTRFSVDWDKARRRLRVDVREGRVRVSGGGLPQAGVMLDAGDSLEQLEPRVDSTPRAPTAAQHDDVKPSSEAKPAEAEVDAGSSRAAPKVSPKPPEWLELAGAAKYREALQAAETAGFQQLITELPANELLILANAARYSGASTRARQALSQLRRRFPGTPSARLAALYIARLAEDSDNNPAEAARWLRVFLKESPSGGLAAGARADLIRISLRLGNRAAAREVAQDYLRHHPNGPHSKQARELLRSTSSR